MSHKVRRCQNCRQDTQVRTIIPEYSLTVKIDGVDELITIKDYEVYECIQCNARTTTDEGEEQLSKVFLGAGGRYNELKISEIPKFARLLDCLSYEDHLESITALDQREAVKEAFSSHLEVFILTAKIIPPCEVQANEFTFFPRAGRGAACAGAHSRWTDCDSIEDLIDRWDNFEERWAN